MQLRDCWRTLERITGLFALLFFAESSWADTNCWIKPTSGDWQEETSWSLGVLPDSSQSVLITNAGEKTITVNSATALNYSISLTVNDLAIVGTNTLLLDNAGTNVPLRVLNGLWVSSGATVVNLESGLVLENAGLYIEGQIFQNGGFVLATNGFNYLDRDGDYHLTNGILQMGSLQLGNGYSGHFHQYGGAAKIKTLKIQSNFAGSSYHLYDGELMTDLLRVGGGADAFFHHGGTNRSLELEIAPIGLSANYFLESGLLCTSNMLVAVAFSESTFTQSGGIHIVTNTLRLQGTEHQFARVPANYILANAVLSAGTIEIAASVFKQTNGVTSVAQTLHLNLESELYVFSSLFLFDGTLACSNALYGGAGADISQSGGAFIIANLFSFGGYKLGNGQRYARYDFDGGTLMSTNIELVAEMTIGSSAQVGRITNPGYFKMAGTLTSGDANEQLGRFIVASDATINLGNGDAKLSFANSSAENWTNAAILIVTNWSGSPTGGGNDQLRFGSDAAGLTGAQLNQIRFANPAGFSPGEYFALILNTGEIVPAPRPMISFGKNGTDFVLSWTGDFSLQTATNVIGPYQDLVGASSPYTNDVQSSERYFRLRR